MTDERMTRARIVKLVNQNAEDALVAEFDALNTEIELLTKSSTENLIRAEALEGHNERLRKIKDVARRVRDDMYRYPMIRKMGSFGWFEALDDALTGSVAKRLVSLMAPKCPKCDGHGWIANDQTNDIPPDMCDHPCHEPCTTNDATTTTGGDAS